MRKPRLKKTRPKFVTLQDPVSRPGYSENIRVCDLSGCTQPAAVTHTKPDAESITTCNDHAEEVRLWLVGE